PLALARPHSPEEGGHDTLKGGHACADRSEVVAEAHRRQVRVAEVAGEAGARLDVDLGRRRIRERPALAVTRDRAVDQARMSDRERIVIDAETLHDAPTVTFHQHVGALEQAMQNILARRCFQVYGNAPLVSIELEEELAFAA